MADLIFALLDNSPTFRSPTVASQARELTIAWTRFKYSGPILEHCEADTLLQQAMATGARYCVLQPYGYLLAEVWQPEQGDVAEIMAAIHSWFSTREFLLSGAVENADATHWRTDPGLLLIDLWRYRDAGNPSFERLNPTLKTYDFCPLPTSITRNVVALDKTHDAPLTTLCGYPSTDTAVIAPSSCDHPFACGDTFVDGINTLTNNLRRAVFVWNIESYADIETPPQAFKPPLKALYTVSAGFKPNRILQTHGFNQDTRMVVFDYSAQGLRFRRMLHEQWDGRDYPAFLRRLFRELPPADTHYLLWDGMTPDNLDWDLVENRWQQELAAWGGEQALYQHWQQFRQMSIEYLHCDLLEQSDRLIDCIADQENALIWWSNAFFSIYSLWHYTSAQRRQIFRRWIENLARKSPRLLLQGSDCNNASINGCSAGEYARWLQDAAHDPLDELEPVGLNLRQIRY